MLVLSSELDQLGGGRRLAGIPDGERGIDIVVVKAAKHPAIDPPTMPMSRRF